MDAKTQLIILAFSYLYGFILYYLIFINNRVIKNMKSIYRSIITILFMYNIVLIYIISIFKINNGNFHIYFFIMIILGYISNIKVTKKMANNVKIRKFIEKIKTKCYTEHNKG